MLPPWPPSPPEGPPRGTYFSRRKATQPLPPLPAFTNILASSTNTGIKLQKKDNTSELPVGRLSELHEKAPGALPGSRRLEKKNAVQRGRTAGKSRRPQKPSLHNAVSSRRTWL